MSNGDPYGIEQYADIIDLSVLDLIDANLDLRPPNKAAVANVAVALADHERRGNTGMLEAVVASAVGVGKTYVIAATIDYLAIAQSVRNFAIITPSTVVNEKTIANFTRNSQRSLVGGMDCDPLIITAENFDNPSLSAFLNDDSRVKLFVFTVHSLLTPRKGTKARRRTHAYQEGLGRGLYAHLQGLDDLVVLADEHHAYYGDAFSAAIRELDPLLLVGLTGTPDQRAVDQVVFAYPLAFAIADGFVKLPVIVGRQDARNDRVTKMNDGVLLLAEKQLVIDDYVANTGSSPVNAVMLVLCKDINEAREVADLIESDRVAGGAYRGKVLEIHSKSEEDDLRALAGVEDPASSIRVIVAVDKLKEGWDVKNVYVLASLRPSVSWILTEQTLGRGLRLPFDKRTGIQFIDSLEVLAHERYEELLAKKDVLNKQLVSFRTSQQIVLDRKGQPQVRTETTEVTVDLIDAGASADMSTATSGRSYPTVSSLSDRTDSATLALTETLIPRDDVDPVAIPVLVTTRVTVPWSLANITDLEPFEALGRRIDASPAEELRRTVITGTVTGGSATLGTQAAADEISGYQEALPLDVAKSYLRDHILRSKIAPSRPSEKKHLERILDAVYGALGDKAETALTAHWRTAADRIVSLIEAASREATKSVETSFDVRLEAPFGARIGREETTTDRHHQLKYNERNKLGYEGWAKSLYRQAWFDSDTERKAAVIIDDSDEVELWVRLHANDLPIAWSGESRTYNPDYLVKTKDDVWWVVEVKADNALDSDDVAGKAQAARVWANKVNSSELTVGKWRYLLVGESDIADAKGSLQTLIRLAR